MKLHQNAYIIYHNFIPLFLVKFWDHHQDITHYHSLDFENHLNQM